MFSPYPAPRAPNDELLRQLTTGTVAELRRVEVPPESWKVVDDYMESINKK
jgi:hypothetical protein